MRLLIVAALPVCLLASAFAHTNQPGTVSAQDPQTIKIIRAGSQPSRQGPRENFTGVARVEPFSRRMLRRAHRVRSLRLSRAPERRGTPTRWAKSLS